ncbi:hypothetical protein ACFYKX_20585 [Cytobacillus sp. FJAT-54145]|uniref:Uncharacterized protein n=1 Tax=Cytobacillus spartinae TaxID=3299023 RepID=A0ABW6KIE1_9BACI
MEKNEQNNNSLENDPILKMHLDSYQVDTPDFPMKKSRFSRLLGYLASPSQNPFEPIVNASGSLVRLAITPLVIGTVLVLLQIISVSL